MQKFVVLFLLFLSQVAFAQQKQMSLEDAVWGRYSYLNPESQNFLWKDGNTFSFLKNDTLWAESVKDGKKEALICLPEINKIALSQKMEFKQFPVWIWQNDGNVLLQSDKKYLLLNLAEKKIQYKIVLPEKAENAVFCAAGKQVAYTLDNDLYLAFASGGKQQITFDGGNGIVNGQTVHRNEFGITKGIFNSPKGNYIAFYRKDETMVKDYPLVDFMAREAEYNPVKYPMAGMNSHQVTLGIYNVISGHTLFLKTQGQADHYLTNICWSPDENYIYLAELNREQNHLKLNCYNVWTGELHKTLFGEKHQTYVEPLFPIQFSKVNENEFYYLSRKDGWFHVYKYNTNGDELRQITFGEWEVTQILGFDEKENHLFIEATKESPMENHIYKVEIKTGKIEKLSSEPGIHHGSLSPQAEYVIDNWNATSVPGKIDLLTAKAKLKRNLFTAKDPLMNYQLGENKLVDITTADGKTSLSGRLILPNNFNKNKKYPVVVYVYGGPHSQMVTKGWHNGARWWQYYMASKGYIAFTMDNRGTNNRGRDFETVIHRQLGILETEDQMKGIEYLKSLPYVDSERIGVHGWSYGGFMTLNLMLRFPETFKVGVAGGPVVDWSLYEIMYGERYMDRPQENPEGYKESNMLNHVSKLEGKLMLVHGVQDQTVVMQHSMKFLRECVTQGKQVDFSVYPIHPHNVRGEERIHLMEKVSSYFFQNL